MSIFHPIISDLNLFFYQWSYLVKPLFTLRPGTNVSCGISSDLLTYWGKSPQIAAVSSDSLVPQILHGSLSLHRSLLIQFNDTFHDYPLENNDTIVPLLPLIFLSPLILIYH